MGNNLTFRIGLEADNSKALASAKEFFSYLKRMESDQAAIIRNLVDPTASVPSHILQSKAYMAQAARERARMGSIMDFSKSIPVGHLSAAINQSLGIGAGQNRPARKAYEDFWKSAIPPESKPINWKMMGMGGMAGMFSPWIGARMMNQAMTGGGMGGGAKGFASALLGGGAMGFGEFYILISAVKRAAEVIGHEFVDAIHQGSQALLKAAETGMQIGRLAHMGAAFQMVGLPANSAEKLLAQGQFMRGQKFTSSAVEGMATMGVGRGILSKEEAQGIMNLSKEIADAWQRTTYYAATVSANARDLFKEGMAFTEVKLAWKAFWMEFVSVFGDAIEDLKNGFVILMQALTTLIAFLDAFEHAPGLLWGSKKSKHTTEKFWNILTGNDTGEGFGKFPIGAGGGRPESGWERMGLVMRGGISGVDYARQTAENTRVVADFVRSRSNASSSRTSVPAIHDIFGYPFPTNAP